MTTRSKIEREILGGILANPNAIRDITKVIRADDFGPVTGRVFFAMLLLDDQGARIDHLTVAENLKEAGLLAAVGGPSFILSLDADIGRHADPVSAARQLAAIARAELS